MCSFNWVSWNSWECRRKKWGWFQERHVYCTTESFVSFFKWLFVKILFSSSANFYKGFEIAANERFRNVYSYDCKHIHYFSSVQFSLSVVYDSLQPHESQHARPPCPEFTQTHVHQVSDAIQPSHPLSSPSPPAPNPSQHQSLFQ